MQLEFHQIDLRYEQLRRRNLRKERQILASLAEQGQLLPVVVVAVEGRFVLLDGYKRLRALKRLAHDTVRATVWQMEESEALLLERLMRSSDSEGPLEQGWLLGELKDRFGISLPELARRFDKTVSWVSRRLALVRELALPIQDQVRSGSIAPHTAMKYLVPLARANKEESVQVAEAIARSKLSTREVGELYAGWTEGNEQTRELILADPVLFLRAREAARRVEPDDKPPAQLFLDDLGAMGTIARRAVRRLREGLAGLLSVCELEQAGLALRQVKVDCEALERRWEKETHDARPVATHSDP